MATFDKTAESSVHAKCARAAVWAPAIAVVLNFLFRSAGKDLLQSREANLVVGVSSMGLFGVGLVCAIIALLGIRRHGASGLLLRGIAGLVINGGILGFFAYALLFMRPVDLHTKYSGMWVKELPGGRAMEMMELRPDRQFRYTVSGATGEMTGSWSLRQDQSSKLFLCLVPERLPDGTANTQGKMITMQVDHFTNDTLQVTTDKGPTTYLRKPPPPATTTALPAGTAATRGR
jgi:hypothetical protein